MIRPRVDIDGEVKEVGQRQDASGGWLQYVDAFEHEDVRPPHVLPLPGHDVIGQVRVHGRGDLGHPGPDLLDEAQQGPSVVRLGETLAASQAAPFQLRG
jgi:hypothetical protein